MNQIESVDSILYIYILGQGNSQNFIKGLVPYRVVENKLFYGACKVDIRKEIKSMWDKSNRDFKKMPKIYLAGINPAKNNKVSKNGHTLNQEPRKILFAGKITDIFTFGEAWEHYKHIESNHPNEDYRKKVEKMIIGVTGKNSSLESPLFLEPTKNNDGIEGYKHRTNMHKKRWILDLLSKSELKYYKQKFTTINQKEIFKDEKINFERDCCFNLKNLHFSSRKKPCPIPLNNEMLNLIIKGLNESRKGISKKEVKHPDIYSPFGYNRLGQKYGRLSFVKLENDDAEAFMDLLISTKNKLFSG